MDRTASLARPAVATIVLFVPLVLLDRRMMGGGGTGIIPFELAGPKRSTEILQRWGPKERQAARASLLLDFPFLLSYTVLNVRLARRAQALMSRLGRFRLGFLGPAVALSQVAAGVCDAIENTALLLVLAREGDETLSSIARSAARLKFAGLIIGWLYSAAASMPLR